MSWVFANFLKLHDIAWLMQVVRIGAAVGGRKLHTTLLEDARIMRVVGTFWCR